MDINGGVENPMQQQQQQQHQVVRRGAGGGGNDNHHPPPPLHKCPRCDSSHTKFCYYNNYSLTQPRYYCKACRRYWTQGGTLRNVPIGGGSRKSKRGQIRPLTAGRATPGVVSPLIRPSSLSFPTAVIPPTTIGGGTFYNTGSSLLSSLTAMQPLAANRGVNLGGGSIGNLNLGGRSGGVNLGGGGQFGGNMALLHGLSLPFKAPMGTRQFEQPPTHYFPTQVPSLLPPGFGGNWNQGFGNSGVSTTTSVVTSGVWNCNTGGSGGGNDLAGSSFNPNHWSDNNQGFN